MDWLNNLAVLAGAVGAVLAQAADPGPELYAVLKREPQVELQALLDALEPVALAAGMSWPKGSRFGEIVIAGKPLPFPACFTGIGQGTSYAKCESSSCGGIAPMAELMPGGCHAMGCPLQR